MSPMRLTVTASTGWRGACESLALLYRALSNEGQVEEVDLGIYLSQVASAVMKAHAVEGIRLEMKVDTWLVSVKWRCQRGLWSMN